MPYCHALDSRLLANHRLVSHLDNGGGNQAKRAKYAHLHMLLWVSTSSYARLSRAN